MIEISNLRLEKGPEWTKLMADITSDIKRIDNENTMWIAVKNENSNMLTTDVYNMFLFLPLYMSMFYHTDLHICGCVSKVLYRNVCDYIQPILCSFSNDLSRVKITVDGFKEAEGEHKIIGTGLSCGVDNLSTIYKYHHEEIDSEYKINGLFMLNCGWHGYYDDPKTVPLFLERCNKNKAFADELNVDFYAVDSNLHAFLNLSMFSLGDRISYFLIYTCIFGLERAIGKYYLSSSLSYNEIITFGERARNRDFSEYADPYALPLMHSEKLSLISDGCQYSRSEKTEKISNWSMAKKYLNVCCKNTGYENCSVCNKCTRTLVALEAMGKLNEYSKVFNIDAYKKIAFKSKCDVVIKNCKDVFLTDNYNFCKNKGVKLPSKLIAEVYTFFPRLKRKIKYLMHKS